ncbi:MAG TPA: YgdI/YgdR family lipoprotein [Verrucomicrobiae bacterium]|nr:YgdI/YgdR family lipoprotein [Verrucomicrobiae bacterium]
MKRLALPLLFALGLVCGCANTYVMKLTNGIQLTTSGKPKLKGANYHYKDAQGRDNVIPQSRVEEIEPASMASHENRFVPSPPAKHHWWKFW